MHIWHLDTKEKLREFDAGGQYGYGLAVSPDGHRFATQSDKGTLVCDYDMGELFRLPANSSGLAFSPDGKRLLIGNTLWNLEAKKSERKLADAEETIRSVGFFQDGRHLWIASSNAKTIRMYDSDSGKEVAKVACDTFITTTVEVTDDGRYMVSGGGYQANPFKRDGDYSIRLWQLPAHVFPKVDDE